MNNGQTDIDQTKLARQVYFEMLARLLFSRGVVAADIGQFVIELDDHVAVLEVDPVEEFGPVAQLVDSIAPHLTTRAKWNLLAIDLLGLVFFAILVVTLSGFVFERYTDGVGLSMTLGLLTLLISAVYMIYVKSVQSRLVGKARDEGVSRRVLFVIIFVPVMAYTWSPKLFIWTPVWFTVALIFVSALLNVAVIWWYIRNASIPIPGRLGHLTRRFGGGPFRIVAPPE